MDSESEFELIDVGNAKEDAKGITAMMPKDENEAFPFGIVPPGEA
jgi:hypothetical protein